MIFDLAKVRWGLWRGGVGVGGPSVGGPVGGGVGGGGGSGSFSFNTGRAQRGWRLGSSVSDGQHRKRAAARCGAPSIGTKKKENGKSQKNDGNQL